jgi:ATP-dependent Clp protease ATP-binding subunit ClpB
VILIMTSNVGSDLILEELSAPAAGWNLERVRGQVMAQLRQRFRPEFLNRIDEIVIFAPLTRDDLVQIVRLQVDRVRRRLAEQRIAIELTPEAEQFLVGEGHDRAWGARPLKRAIQRLVETPLSREVLAGRVGEGDTVRIALGDGALTFETVAAPPAAALPAAGA